MECVKNEGILSLNSILPAIITGIVAIVGFFTNFLISIYNEHRKEKQIRVNASVSYYYPLYFNLMELKFYYDNANNIINPYNLFDFINNMYSDITLMEHSNMIISLYENINRIISQNNYVYRNKVLHANIMSLKAHVVCILLIRKIKPKQKLIDSYKKEYPLPDLSILIHDINQLIIKLSVNG